MRRWIARQFQPDRRWQSLWLLLLFAWVALNIAFAAAWDFHSRIDWEHELRVTREMSAQADRVDDLAEKQRLRQAIQARASRLTTLQANESVEGLRRSQVRLRVTQYAIPVLFIAMIPILIGGFRQKRRQRWLKSGCCGGCGYDLRASRDRCPECGTPAAPIVPVVGRG